MCLASTTALSGEFMSAINRRSFLKNAAVAAAAVPFHALLARAEGLAQSGVMRALRSVGYGPLRDALDEATGLPLQNCRKAFAT